MLRLWGSECDQDGDRGQSMVWEEFDVCKWDEEVGSCKFRRACLRTGTR